MPMDVDRYPALGPKRRISGADEALAVIRSIHPSAEQQGSTGAERTWTIGRDRERVLVAHHWRPGTTRGPEIWWLRVAASVEEGIPDGW